ncbi:hypothetical protein [Flavobacterium sp.]|uniref:hypothetical protein n=1 Tax=Flavobacterium sp. TaxID=239 RepID=UPI00262E405E|nr:hypothetical protein [Flavobacterium sp.]
MEKAKLLDLDLGTDAVIQKSVDLKNQLNSLRDSLDKLKKAEGDNTVEIVKQEAALKKVTTEYNNNQKVVQTLITQRGKAIPVQEKANLLLNEEITSMGRAKTSITEITKLRDQLDLSIKEEASLYEKLNEKLNDNNDFMKANGSEREKNILNIGNYRESIVGAIQDTGLMTGELQTLNAVTTALSLPFKELKKDFSSAFSLIKNAASETEGLTNAQKAQTIATNIGTGAMRIFTLALAATGIGLIIAAVALLIGYFKTFDPLIDAIEQGMAGLGAAVRVVQQIIVDFVSSIESVGDLMSKIGAFIEDPIGSLEKVADKMEKAAVSAANLKAAQQDLADQQAIQSLANKKQEAEIARLILQSKNRALSEEDRIALLKKAEALNQDNFKKNEALANQEYANAIENARIKGALTEQEIANLQKVGIAYAYKLLNIGKITQEEVDILTKAEEAKLDIYNRATAEEEKIINRQNALAEKAQAEAEARAKKAEEARKKALDNAAKLAKAELDLFLSSQGIKAKSLEQEIAIAEKVRDQKLKIAKAEFNASEKTKADELKLLTDQNNIRDEFLRKQVEAVVKNYEYELIAFIDANKSKIDSQKFFNELSLQQEQNRLDLLLEKQLQYEALRLEQGVINEQEYQLAIKKVQDDIQTQKDEAVQMRKDAETEKQAIDLENQRAYEDLVFQDNLAIQQQRLEQERLQKIAEVDKTGADIEKINKRYKAASEKLDREANIAKISNTQNTIGEIGQLTSAFFGENKELSAALASVDMFLAIQKAYLSQLIPGDPTSIARATAAAFKAGAFGLANVIKVSGVKLASGGRVFGPGTGTSDSIPAMLSNGETVINAESSNKWAGLLSAINVDGGGKAFASGGMATTFGVSQSLGNAIGIDYDLLAVKIADANRSLPTPVLPLTDFHSANNSYIEVISGANS